MFHIYNEDKGILISTNFKVMNSSLNYFFTNINKSYAKVYLDHLEVPDIFISEHYLLIRNPYKRIISFYKDKFIYFSKVLKNDINKEYRDVQKLIFPYLGVDEKIDSRENIIKKLKNTSFDGFICNILPSIFSSDLHLTPQNWIFYRLKWKEGRPFIASHKKRSIFNNVKIIKIENIEEMETFSRKTGFDIRLKIHSTEMIKDPDLTPDSIKVINDIYKDDFEIFGYLMSAG